MMQIHRQQMYIRVHLLTASFCCAKTSLLCGTTDILSVDAVDAPYIFKREEVINMLIGEYDYDTDIAVQRKESFEIGLAEGEARGEARGRSEGSRQAKLETARILKQLGDSVQKIAQATGLSQAEVEAIKS